MPTPLETRYLLAAVILAEELSFTGAAKRLKMSQSGVKQQTQPLSLSSRFLLAFGQVTLRLGLAFSFLVVILIAVGDLGLRRMDHINADLQDIVGRRTFKLMLSRYVAIRRMQVVQTAACNRLHDIEQRLARWLLMTLDRVDSASLSITHDSLATMLGTDRPTVSLAAAVLQRTGLIEYTRGAVVQ